MNPDYKNIIHYHDGMNSDIIKVLESSFEKSVNQTKDFAHDFKGSNILDTCENVWNFIKNNIPYKADSQEFQKIVLPSRAIERAENDGIGCDCKSMALMAISLIKNCYPDAKAAFRYTSYRSSTTPTHVYCIVQSDKYGTIIIDPVWHEFNSQKKYTLKTDHYMKIATLSGINDDKDVTAVDAYTYNFIKTNTAAMKSFPVGSPEYEYFANNLREAKKLMNESAIGIGRKNVFKSLSNGIAKKVDKVKKEIKKVAANIVPPKGVSGKDYAEHLAMITTFAMQRNAFLLLLKFNYRDLCNRILDHSDSVTKLWYKLGGQKDVLITNCNAFKHKKPLFGKPKGLKGTDEFGIGEPVSIAAITATITAATPIVLAVMKLLPKHKQDDSTEDITLPDGTTTTDGSTTPDGSGDDGTKVFGMKPQTLLIGGAIAAGTLYFLYKKK